MKPNLKSIHSPDVNDLETYLPEEPDDFCILVQATIGLPNDNSGESFDFLVCTPKWIETLLENQKFVLGKGYLVVRNYNYNLIIETIQSICDRVSGDDWITVANKLARYGQWEFEDYTLTGKSAFG